jgi:phosphopantothenoylcysteine decarboxylase/phosphopantothenate--cysteine ligase
MLDVEDIAAYLHAFDSQRPLFEKKVLITCGATAEPIDPVRIITNRSSGRMGVALAAAAWAFGAKVTVVHGSMHARFPAAARLIPIATAQEMQRTLEKEFSECDLCVMAAAVSDFTIEQPSAGKIAREGQASLDLKLRPTPDIARSLGQRKRPGQKLVGFALESAAGEERALQKMLDKSCDLMILNHPQIALGGEVTQITILSPSRAPERLPRMDKRLAARHILIRAAELLGVE